MFVWKDEKEAGVGRGLKTPKLLKTSAVKKLRLTLSLKDRDQLPTSEFQSSVILYTIPQQCAQPNRRVQADHQAVNSGLLSHPS